MIGLYFSGTGNTKHCTELFIRCLDDNAVVISIEAATVKELIAQHDTIIFGYPIYFSSLPKIVRDFMITNKDCFKNKRIFIIATMGLFSGDGAGCSARLFKRYGAEIIGALHIKMPDCIGDEKVLKKSIDQNKKIIERADLKIRLSAQKLNKGKPPQNGLNILYHIAGLLGQRLWFYNKTTTYKNKPDIDNQKCTGCGRCVALCPMNNIQIREGKAVAKGKCTMCYRCFSYCPNRALTILGKNVYEQCRFENYK